MRSANGCNLFYYVYVLSFYDRARDDQRYLEALGLLQSRLDARGAVVVERPNRKLGHLSLCAAGRPSELATGRYREIFGELGDADSGLANAPGRPTTASTWQPLRGCR